MNSKKITELVQTTTVADSDLFIVETNDGTRAVHYSEIKGSGGSDVSFNGTGVNSIAVGAKANGDNSTAVGYFASANGGCSIAVGDNANTNGDSSIAIGSYANANGACSIAMGNGTFASEIECTAIGSYANANGDSSIALGSGSKAYGGYSTAIGSYANANGINAAATAIGGRAKANGGCSTAVGRANANEFSTAVGYFASANGGCSIAMGYYSSSTGDNSTAIGGRAKANGGCSTALGANAKANGGCSTAIGYNAQTANANSIQLGDATNLSSITSKVPITTTSDERDKANITEIEDNILEFLNKVKAIRYVFNGRKLYIDNDNLSDEEKEKLNTYGMCEYDREAHEQGTKKGTRIRVGVSAQNIQQALIDVFGDSGYANLVNDNLFDYNIDEIPEGVESQLAVNYEGFIPFLIKAIQELYTRVKALEKK